MIFAGSGCTGAIDKLIGILGLRIPSELDDRYRLSRRDPADQRPVVFIGPFEHHSNELPWRESIADVVVIPQDADGHIDLDALEQRTGPPRRPAAEDRLVLGGQQRHRHRQRHRTRSPPCCTSTARCRSGTSPPPAPYVEHRHVRRPPEHAGAYKDAIFLSPHKFIGGPGTPGVLVVRRELLTNRVPDVPGGGTVAVRQPGRAPLPRRPGRTARRAAPRPSSSRSAPGWSSSSSRPSGSTSSAPTRSTSCAAPSHAWQAEPAIEILGNLDAERLSIVSFVVRAARRGRYLHHNFVVALLNDLFGIQARGGCSCAGPYGHRLLGIDLERSHEFEREIAARLRGHQARLGAGQLQLLHLRRRRSTTSIDAVTFVARHGQPAARRLPLRPRPRPLAPPHRPRRAAACAWTSSLRRTTATLRYPRHAPPGPRN